MAIYPKTSFYSSFLVKHGFLPFLKVFSSSLTTVTHHPHYFIVLHRSAASWLAAQRPMESATAPSRAAATGLDPATARLYPADSRRMASSDSVPRSATKPTGPTVLGHGSFLFDRLAATCPRPPAARAALGFEVEIDDSLRRFRSPGENAAEPQAPPIICVVCRERERKRF